MRAFMNDNCFYLTFGKRIFDIVTSFSMCLLLMPLFFIVALIIKCTSKGPAIYKQIRVGKNCKDFVIYKFRTMVANADTVGPTSTADGDARITPQGRFLRKTSIDELPQFFNVLIGNMSLVGYRPDVRRGNEIEDDEKYKLKPGITGYAQIYGRSDLTIEMKRYWEQRYNKDVSFYTDIKVLCLTVKVVLLHRGSN